MPQYIGPPTSRFSFRETTPSNGAFITRLSMICWARCMASIAFWRFSCATAIDAWLFAARDLTSSLSCASRRCASSSDSTFFCAATAAMNSLPITSSSAAAHVELRREQRDVVLRLLHGGVGRHLRDFLLGLGNFRLRLLERELLIGRIELHHRRRLS